MVVSDVVRFALGGCNTCRLLSSIFFFFFLCRRHFENGAVGCSCNGDRGVCTWDGDTIFFRKGRENLRLFFLGVILWTILE